MLAFQSFIADNTSTVYTEVPHEHLGVIASLAQESDKNETELAKRIHATLFPEGSEIITASGEKIDMLSVTAIQTSLRAIATRVNYGVEATSEDAVPSVRTSHADLTVTSALALGSARFKFATKGEPRQVAFAS